MSTMTLHPLEYETLHVVRQHALLFPGARVVIGVSGGADSLALLLVLTALRGQLDVELTAAYVDHGLRPAEARAEAGLVADQAKLLGVAFRTGVIPVQEKARQTGQSLEAAGRELRYEFLQRLAGELGGAVIAVAHQADDQAEEILLRLLRGSGRAGLAGMSWINAARVIRPFLGFSKGRLLDYLRERGGRFLEDSSNSDHRFRRNRVRLEILPLLEKRFNPAVRESLLRTAKILGAEEELLADLARRAYALVRVDRHGGGECLPGLLLEVATLHREPLALQRRVLELALVELATPVSFQAIEDLLDLATRTSGELHLPGGLRVVREYGLLRFSHPVGRGVARRGRLVDEEAEPFELLISGPGLWTLEQPGLSILVESLEHPPDPAELRGGRADYLDAAAVSLPLVARYARPGDRFRPLGGPGKRKVADFLNDRKLPRSARKRVVVLESSGRICALLGLRIDQRCRLSGNTGRVLKVSLAT
jgi:tRNA(Ile)-lysidine synthase